MGEGKPSEPKKQTVYAPNPDCFRCRYISPSALARYSARKRMGGLPIVDEKQPTSSSQEEEIRKATAELREVLTKYRARAYTRWKCSECGSDNKAEWKFCLGCGIEDPLKAEETRKVWMPAYVRAGETLDRFMPEVACNVCGYVDTPPEAAWCGRCDAPVDSKRLNPRTDYEQELIEEIRRAERLLGGRYAPRRKSALGGEEKPADLRLGPIRPQPEHNAGGKAGETQQPPVVAQGPAIGNILRAAVRVAAQGLKVASAAIAAQAEVKAIPYSGNSVFKGYISTVPPQHYNPSQVPETVYARNWKPNAEWRFSLFWLQKRVQEGRSMTDGEAKDPRSNPQAFEFAALMVEKIEAAARAMGAKRTYELEPTVNGIIPGGKKMAGIFAIGLEGEAGLIMPICFSKEVLLLQQGWAPLIMKYDEGTDLARRLKETATEFSYA